MSNHADSYTVRLLLEDCTTCGAQPGEPCKTIDGLYRCPDEDCDQEWTKESDALSCTFHLEAE